MYELINKFDEAQRFADGTGALGATADNSMNIGGAGPGAGGAASGIGGTRIGIAGTKNSSGTNTTGSKSPSKK